MGIFVITKSPSGDHRFNLDTSTGETILTSAHYATKSSCEIGIVSVMSHAP